MAYDTQLADRIRVYLEARHEFNFEEKRMFGGLAFMLNGKMCVNVSGQNLMCRFNPSRTKELAERKGFMPMIMKNKVYQGYCYVEPLGFETNNDFEFWIEVCLSYNIELS